jgi:predicted PurR-regulated permease PerM
LEVIMQYKEKFFKYTCGAILVLTIIFLLGQLDFFFAPFQKFIAVLFFPVLVSGLLYYLLRPLVRLAERARITRTLAILLLFLLIIIVITLFSVYAGSLISKQFDQLLADLPKIVDAGRIKAEVFLRTKNLGAVLTGKIGEQITTTLQKVLPFLMGNILNAVTALAGIASALLLVPFILFYFLKDDANFSAGFMKHIPHAYQNEVHRMMAEADLTLAAYIIGQAFLALILGILLYIGYLVIGVRYSLILAIFALITSFIPVFGSIIGVIPAILVGLATGPWAIVKILVLVIIVHFFEGNLISPRLIGKRLKVHPLTIIFLFLVSASLFGFVGMLIAAPVYAIGKIFIKSMVKIYKGRS